MQQQSKRNITINGSGSASGGVYRDVKIKGDGSVGGDLECIDYTCHGTSSVTGNITSKRFKIYGTTSIDGSLQSDNIHIYGQVDVKEDVTFKHFKSSGGASISGNLTGEEINLKGGMDVEGNCEAEVFNCRGCFSIGGLLSADDIDIKLYAKSKAKEIGGEKIIVKKHPLSLINMFFSFSSRHLSVDVIEGDQIYLENTKAQVVRGNTVEIGPGCDIALVEYKTDFRQADDTQVTEHKKI